MPDNKKTYNSVGKSLMIRLIHFCLGSSQIEEFKTKIPDWEFQLDFEIAENKYCAKRKTSNQNEIILNEESLSIREFNNKLSQEVFGISSSVKYLGFRPLISRFIRPKKNSYNTYDKIYDEETPFARLLFNSYLLGLDKDLILEKNELKSRFDKIDVLKRNIENDEILKSFFIGEQDVDIEIIELKTSIDELESKLKSFIIAEDYDKIKYEADEISAQRRSKKNQFTLLNNAIRNIDKSLEIEPDITTSKLKRLFEEASFDFGNQVVKKLNELNTFHKQLLKDRQKRLLEEKKRFEKDLIEVQKEITRLGKIEDLRLQYLNKHGALEEYTALNSKLINLKVRIDKLITYQSLLEEYKNEKERVKIEFSEQNIKTNDYLKKIKTLLENNILIFKEFAKRFYKDKTAGIIVANNDGINTLRYNLEVKIQDDAGDGVNEVKLFCYDWTILKSQHNHQIKFIVHDSRILSDIDPRQRATLFKLAHENSTVNNFQYIVTANQDLLDSIKPYFENEPYSFEDVITKQTVLELTDESAESKLLGIQVDMDYEKE